MHRDYSQATPLEVLRDVWGYTSFRPMQEEVIRSVLRGDDSLALMPTGGGKSITFQVPALILEGITLVITPLVALMRDQVEKLKSLGINAQALYSGMTRGETLAVLDNIVYAADYKILYIAPERLQNELFLRRLGAMDISLMVVDECHCSSQWGYDFRPDYMTIASVRSIIGEDVPMLALTATAPPRVVEDVIRSLEFRSGYKVFKRSFYRDNLSYVVRRTYNKPRELIHILSSVEGSSLVYVRTRRQAERFAQLLQDAGFSADFFHAGLDPSVKQQRQQAWQSEELRIMVCTTAFGMGIDKENVRLVIHPISPFSPESYYQEAGRAGRDGKRSYAVLLYTPLEDEEYLSKLIKSHYPPPETVVQIYNWLGDYFRVAVESGTGSYHELLPYDFIKRYHCPLFVLKAALKILTLSGYIEHREDYHMASRLIFTINRNDLYTFFSDDEAKYDDLVELLLRSYEGIFTEYAFIDESMIQTKLGLSPEQLYRMLIQMRRWGVIEYIPGKRSDYVVYTQQRLPSREVKIPAYIYDQQLGGEIERLTKMIDYIRCDDSCRVRILMEYFGEKAPLPCGYCDYCLSHKTKTLTYRLIHEISETLLDHPDGIVRQELSERFPTLTAKQWDYTLSFLASQGYTIDQTEGKIRLHLTTE